MARRHAGEDKDTRAAERSRYAASVNAVQEIIDYLEAHLLEDLSPGLVARRFALSVSALGSLFAMICDVSLMAYVRRRRLSEAGRALKETDRRVIDIALMYGYETPEAFAKAFTRFHGDPPSLLRRLNRPPRQYRPLRVTVDIQGGWEPARNISENGTDAWREGQETGGNTGYAVAINYKGAMEMANETVAFDLHTRDMAHREDWHRLLALAQRLDSHAIVYKVDGATAIFAHGLTFALEKICLTFKWADTQGIMDFFGYDGEAVAYSPGFQYFDTAFEGMKVWCMFYGDRPEESTDESLFRNTDLVRVDGQLLRAQTLAFYHRNGDPGSEHYRLVDAWFQSQEK